MKLTKALETVLLTSAFAGVINLISFYAFFQNTDVAAYGQAVAYIAGFSLIWSMLAGFDSSLSRLVNTEDQIYLRHKLISVVEFKIILIFLINGIVLLIYSTLKNNYLIEFNHFLLGLVWLKVNIFTIYTLILHALISSKNYFKHRTASIFYAVCNLLFTFINIFYFSSSVILWITFEIISAIFTLILVLKVKHFKNLRESHNLKFKLNKNDKKFIANLSFNSVLGAFKQNILFLVLGSLGLYVLIGQLNAIKYVFDWAHNFLANTIQKLYPIFIDYKNKTMNSLSFTNIYFYFSAFRLLISFCLFIFLTKMVMPDAEIIIEQSKYSISFIVLIFVIEFSILQTIQTVFVAFSYLSTRADMIWKNGLIKVISQIFLLSLIVFLEFKYALIYVGILSSFCCFLHIVFYLKLSNTDDWNNLKRLSK